MRVDFNSDKPIFRPPHKLGELEWDFVEAHYKKLEGLHQALHPSDVRVSHGGGAQEGRGGQSYRLS